MRLDIEKLMKNLKDVTLQHTMNLRQSDDTVSRKNKEIECLLKEKKCKNCILCLEDLKDKNPDQALIQDLNDRLMLKSKRIDTLEDQQRKCTFLVNQVCQ